MNRSLAPLQSALVVSFAIGFAPSAFPSGTGIPLFGNPIPAMNLTITRQIVIMESLDGHMVGSPHSGSLVAILLDASGCAANEIVLDEKATKGGRSSLLQMVLPSCQRGNFQATLFLRHGKSRVRFEKSGDSNWVECNLELLRLPSPRFPAYSEDLTSAFVVNNPGLIELLEDDASDPAPAGLQFSWTADLPTRTSRAAWHLFWPGLVLGVFVMLSWAVHRTATVSKGRAIWKR